MNGIAIMLVAATIGVDYGWAPREDGTLDYIIQIEPELYESLRAGGEIVSEIHPDARNVSRIRIRIGRDELPRVNVGAAPENTPTNAPENAVKIDPQVRPAAAETSAEAREPTPESLSIRGQSPAADRSFAGSRYERNSNSNGRYNTPVVGVTNSVSPTGSSTATRSPVVASGINASDTTPRYGATLAGRSTAIGRPATESYAGARQPEPRNPPVDEHQEASHGEYSAPGSLPPKAAAPRLSHDAASTNPTLTTPAWRPGETSQSLKNSPPRRFDFIPSVRDDDYSHRPPSTAAANNNTVNTAANTAAVRPAASEPRSTQSTELGQLRAPPPHSHADGTVHASSTNQPAYGRRMERPSASTPQQPTPQRPTPQQSTNAAAPPQQPAYSPPSAYQTQPAPAPNPAGYATPYPPVAPPGYVTIPAYQVAATPSAPTLPVPATSTPSASAPVAAAPAGSPLLSATSKEAEKPWPTLVFTIIMLFASIGGNLYLGWIAWDFGERYKSIASELRGINLAAG